MYRFLSESFTAVDAGHFFFSVVDGVYLAQSVFIEFVLFFWFSQSFVEQLTAASLCTYLTLNMVRLTSTMLFFKLDFSTEQFC